MASRRSRPSSAITSPPFIEVLLRDIARLEAARDIVDLLADGRGRHHHVAAFRIDRDAMAHLLGFAAPLQNSYGCIASVDYITATYSAIELVFLHLGRLIQDLQFWTSFEVGQVYVPNAFVQICSIMPQKRNPVPIEHLRHLASQTVGRAQAMLDDHAQHALHRHERQRGREPGLRATAPSRAAGGCSTCSRRLLPALRIDPERVPTNIRRSCITVTELADSLVRLEGLSFREAHEIAADVARAVVAIEGDLADRRLSGLSAKPFNAAQAARRQVEPTQFADDRLAGAFRRRPRPFRRSGSEGACRPRSPDTTGRSRTFAAGCERPKSTPVASAQDLQSRFTALLGGR